MIDHDIHPMEAEAVFRDKFRRKLASRGYQGAALDRMVEELMNAPVRFQLDLADETVVRDAGQP